MLTPHESLITLNLIPGLGTIRIQALLEFFGSAELALAAPKQLLQQVNGIGARVADAIANWRNCTDLEGELQCAHERGVRLITIHDDEYPPALRKIYDPPIVLYVKGGWIGDSFDRSASIVGARLATAYGIGVTEQFARDLGSAGCCIISGLAKGIDAAAHRGALLVGAKTIGILGSGHSFFYPDENRGLADQMVESGGAVVSEFPMGMRPSRTSFPQRNRIVAAWSQLTLVTEAPLRSGSLHTARLAAAEYGHPVFAVPGSIHQSTSAGCHQIIRDGAILTSNAHQILEDMSWMPQAPQQLKLFESNPILTAKESTPSLKPDYLPIIQSIQQGLDTLDALCTALGLAAHELNPKLMRMQIEGILLPQSGARFSLHKHYI